MRSVKILFIAMEIVCLSGVVMLSSVDVCSGEGSLFKSLYVPLFSLMAVAMQREQQRISWKDDE